ncbi:2-methylcitrate dehydratase PrpD [Apiospora hydei]|uniref:2-methylcitrate dehydratase PrpD n=1 Tax=Apiospora hydei TaxID=1337664 RepID=A0ABR1XBA9_9PEZI
MVVEQSLLGKPASPDEVAEAYIYLVKNTDATGSIVSSNGGPLAATILKGAFIQATELDDYHSSAPLHSAAVVIPTLLAAVQFPSTSNGRGKSQQRVTGLDFLIAAVVGFESGPRAGLALVGPELLTRGWHSGVIFGCPAAALASARLLVLSANQTESAVGIACTQAGGLMSATYKGMIKRVQHAFAARARLFGALPARNGYVGIRKVFERRYGGFLAMFSQGNGADPPYDVRRVVADLGARWEVFGIRVKPHACLGHIVSIPVGLSGPKYAHDGWESFQRPLATTGAQTNVAYSGASQLVDGQMLLEQFADRNLDRDEVRVLVQKTSCYYDARFDRPHFGCGARVAVEFDGGFQVETFLDQPRGYNPRSRTRTSGASFAS